MVLRFLKHETIFTKNQESESCSHKFSSNYFHEEIHQLRTDPFPVRLRLTSSVTRNCCFISPLSLLQNASALCGSLAIKIPGKLTTTDDDVSRSEPIRTYTLARKHTHTNNY